MGRTYVALDTEATGLRADADEIIEIGAVKFRDGQALDRWQSFIRPAQPIPYKVIALTGITRSDVAAAPTLFQAAPGLLRFLGDCHIVGHSIEMDLQLLARQGVRLPARAYDTFELATLLLPEVPVYTLVGVAAALGVPAPVQHRALADAELAMHVFEALVGRLHELPLEVLTEINHATARSEWPLRFLFQEVEREAARIAFPRSGAGIRTRLQAAGISQAELDLGLIHPPPLPDPLPAAPPDTPLLPLDEDALAADLAPDGALAAALPDYEPRPPQTQMLRAVARAFNQRRHLLVEAAPGTGRALAYLWPALQFALANHTPVVVAAGTPARLDQLIDQALPTVQRALAAPPPTPPTDDPAAAWEQALATAQLGRKRKDRSGAPLHSTALSIPHSALRTPHSEAPFHFALLKEQSQYLCLRRWAAFRKRAPANLEELRMLVKVLIWLPRTATGDRRELLLINAENDVWAGLAVSDDGCPLHECIYNQKGLCFHYRARRQAEAAQVLVVPHALLLADIAAGHTLLPPYRHLIIDDAHLLEEEATRQLGYSVDAEAVRAHLDALSRANGPDHYLGVAADLRACLDAAPPVHNMGVAAAPARQRVPPATLHTIDTTLATLHSACDRARTGAADLFARLSAFLAGHSEERNEFDKRLRLTAAIRRQPAWGEIALRWEPLQRDWQVALDALTHLADLLDESDEAAAPDLAHCLLELRSQWRAGVTLTRHLDALLCRLSEGAVYWLAANAREGTLALRCAPLHIGDLLDRYLFRSKDTVILTSTTLSTEGDFAYIRERLGLHAAEELHIGPPAGADRTTLLYVADDLPEPNQPGYQRALEQALIDLCLAAGGHTLVLFTSHSALRTTYKGIARPLEDAGLLVLGHNLDGSRRQLLDRFRRTGRSVLMGTATFWDGSESLGDTLRVLAIPKLPFNVPSDPLFAARSEQFDDAFQHYALPQTVLRFRQGVDRLAHSHARRAAIALLDGRVLTKRYGPAFLSALPPGTLQTGPAHHLAPAVADWLQSAEDGEAS